jgi:hypothetical protein
MQHHFPILFENILEHLDGENYFAVDNIQVIAEGELVDSFAIGTTRVLYSHHLFTKRGF